MLFHHRNNPNASLVLNDLGKQDYLANVFALIGIALMWFIMRCLEACQPYQQQFCLSATIVTLIFGFFYNNKLVNFLFVLSQGNFDGVFVKRKYIHSEFSLINFI